MAIGTVITPRKVTFALFVAILAFSFVLPQRALARDCVAPPGTSGIDQYCESVPSAGSDTGGSSGRESRGSVSDTTKRELKSAGKAGQDLLNLVNGSAGPGSNSTGREDGSSSGNQRRAEGSGASSSSSNDPLSAVGSSIDSGSSAGPGFVWILVIAGLVLSALAWLRYRRRGHASDA